jgi:peptidylamidoglycolate lyase
VTIDSENNVWLTDVAMHQVFQFPPYGGKDKQPNIVLGKPVSPAQNRLILYKTG